MVEPPSPDPSDRLTQRIIDAALELGFDRCAIAPAARLPAADRLSQWLESGRHGNMRWMERTERRRADPGFVLPRARSVVMVALNYHTLEPATEDADEGRISRYAWGDEYHEVIGEMLRELVARLRAWHPEIGCRWYVDTGPVLEKAFAQRAGMGWIGKHTNLISRDLGSWIFLGALLLDVELSYGQPHGDYCGTCRRCIDVCPTAAIVAPYVLDARLCISYLTIENRGPIPVELRGAIGNRIFGCDDCQDVCPWNRFARLSHRANRFLPRHENRAPSLISLLEMDADEFASRFATSPIRRAKHEGFRRNVAVALGNSGNRDAVPALRRALRDGSSLVRGHVAWALGQIGGEAALAALSEASTSETDGWVREEIRTALSTIEGA